MEAPPRREFGFRREEVIQEGSIDLDRGVSPGELGETWGLAGSDEFLRRPDIVGCCLCQEFGPVGLFGYLNRLEVSLSRESGSGHGGFSAMLSGISAGFGVFLAQGSKGWGPPVVGPG